MDTYAQGDERTAIPVGLYSAGGTRARCISTPTSCRPESAHLSISGVSGLATKTSAVVFLLNAIFQHSPRGRAGSPRSASM